MPTWTKYVITQGFGPTDEPLDSGYKGAAHFNKGLDFGIPAGTPIDSPVSGTVIQAGPGSDGWGTSVKIRDAEGNTHNLGHLASAQVKVGQQVTSGQIVGVSGNTGASTGPHLSYDVWDSSGEFFDPSRFIGMEGGEGAKPLSDKPPADDWFDSYAQDYARFSALDKIASVVEAVGGNATYRPGVGWVSTEDESVLMSETDYFEYQTLEESIASQEEEYTNRGGDLNDAISWAKYLYDTDPRLIDADNAAAKFSREMKIREDASLLARNAYNEQRLQQDASEDSFARKIGGGVGAFRVPSMNLPNQDQLFDKAIERVRKGLPDVPDMPYPERITRPDTMPSLAELRSKAAGSAKSRLPDVFNQPPLHADSSEPIPGASPFMAASPSMSRSQFIDYDLGRKPQPMTGSASYRIGQSAGVNPAAQLGQPTRFGSLLYGRRE